MHAKPRLVVSPDTPGLMRGLFALLAGAWLSSVPVSAENVHALAMHGTPKYGAAFENFDYVDPAAPKGGSIVQFSIGTFDSLNPFILKGVPAAGIGQVFETLTEHAADEAFSEYGLLAERIEVAPDNTWVAYRLRPQARWHDGKPVTADDVVFSFDMFKTLGHPRYRFYYSEVVRAEKLGERHVKFHFASGDNAELALIMGQLYIIPRHGYETKAFDKTTLDPPLGSGPYRVKSLQPGRHVEYERVADYWGADLPVNKGRHNFGTIRYDYYRDQTVALEAFKAGEYDFRAENNSKMWATLYTGKAIESGLIKVESLPHEIPAGMQGFGFNTRRAFFADRRVRAALAHAFDFEWSNKNLFYGQYARTRSYFENSELAARGLPTGEELAVLERYRDQLPPEVFNQPFEPPGTDGSGNVRKGLRAALKLLKASGWVFQDKKLVNAKTGEPFAFEMLLVSPAFERIALPFKNNLARLGIDMRIRTVDSAQYQKRIESFDFDMHVFGRGQSLSPGNEQLGFWGSAAADTPGSSNTLGVRDPVVDAIIRLVMDARSRESLVARTRALDRVLLWGHYVIPNWHSGEFRVAYWDKFARPETRPKYSFGLDTWWVDPVKSKRIAAAR